MLESYAVHELLNEWPLTLVMIYAVAMGLLNIAYAFFSNRPRRMIVLMRGLISIYLAIIYYLFIIDILLHMRNFMRFGVVLVLTLFTVDTLLMWLGGSDARREVNG